MEETQVTNNNNNNFTSSFGLKQQHEASPVGDFHLNQPLSENPTPLPERLSTTTTASAVEKGSENGAAPFSLTMPVKKKRGRPKKYNPDGSLVVTPLSPMPISSSVPLTAELASRKRGRGRGRGEHNNNNIWLKNPSMFKFDNNKNNNSPGARTSEVVSSSFTPHVLTVNTGEDVTMKIMTFSQQGSRAICILSANGPISNVTLRQSTTSGGTLTYEGHFEILSLTGLFIPSESGGTRSRAGGMSVSLAGPDGRVFGGGLSGLFIAAGPVQVIIGSFVAGQEELMQKQRRERFGVPTTTQASNISFGGLTEDPKARYGLSKPVVIQTPPEPRSNTDHGNNTNNTAKQIKELFYSFPEDEDDDEEFGGHSDMFQADN